jgi:curli biogenesis system outer membrane secretion channel CsgG
MDGNYATPIGTAPVTANPTDYSAALVCLNQYAKQNRIAAPRVAIGRIADYTGKEESDGSGRKVTQGASLLAMTAFAKAGMPMVERFDTSVSEFELKYANNKLISDRPTPSADVPVDYRRIIAGQVPGSDFYVVGGITELNYNIRSAGVDAYVGDKDTDGLKGNFKPPGVRDEHRPGPAPGEHPHAGSGRRRRLPEAGGRPRESAWASSTSSTATSSTSRRAAARWSRSSWPCAR